MESQRVVVVVEKAEAARAALRWAVRNFLRSSDCITLLYVCPLTRSKKKQRNLRLKGFQLALSFKDLCNGIAELTKRVMNNKHMGSGLLIIKDVSYILKIWLSWGVDNIRLQAKVEIIVTEGDQGASVVSMVNKIGASALVVGLHDQSFLYKTPIPTLGTRKLNCRILAIKEHPNAHEGPVNTEFSQVEITRLCKAEPKNPCPNFPLSLGFLWRKPKRRK